MKQVFLLFAFLITTFPFLYAQVPTLGTYPATTVATSGNTVVTPSVQPASANSISVASNTSFKGVLLVNPATGVVSITNAYPAGDYIVTVKAVSGAQSASRNFLLHVNNTPCSQGYFSSRTGSITTSGPFSLAAGDFNGDGRQDIATTNYYSGSVSICLNNNTDSFAAPLPVVVGGIPAGVAVGDFNNDGKLDFAASINDSSRVAIRLGNGTGSFTVAPNVSTDIRPAAIAVGDFNSDGNTDLAIVSNYYPGNVAIRLGNAAGGFTGTTNITVGNYPNYVATGDFNDDGRTDLAVSNSNTNNVTILTGSGTGSFITTSTVAVGTYPSSVVVADFNGDGEQDFATANNSSANISIRLGNGTGTFTAANDIGGAGYAIFLTSGDWKGDGYTDLACADFTGNKVGIYLGTGTGSFYTNDYPNSNYGTTSNPRFLVTGDFNGDGRQDCAIGGSGLISIRQGLANDIVVRGNNADIPISSTTPSLQNHTDFGNVNSSRVRSFTIRNTSLVSLIINSISIGGADSTAFTRGGVINFPALILPGDSLTFRIVFIPNSPGVKNAVVTVRSNHCTKSTYSFAIQATGAAITPQLGTYPAATIASAGGSAMVASATAPANTETLTAYTTPNFKGQLQVNPVTGLVTITNAQPAGIYTITVKANGLATASSSFTLTVGNTLCSQGNTAAATNLTAFGGRPNTIISSDFNSDGKPDIAYVASNFLSTRMGNGAGGFSNAVYTLTPIDYGIVSADFNGDGNPDLAGVSSTTNSVIIYSGSGDTAGSFTRTTDVSIGVTPRAIATADFNSDGIADFATANVNANTVSIRLGNRAGFFSALPDITVGRLPAAIAAADFNNDGRADLAISNSGGDSVTVLLGDGTGGFVRAPKVTVQAGPGAIAIADLNGDGNQDLLVANVTGNTVSVRIGNGAGGFSDTTNLPSGSAPYALQTGDFNGDGKTDFICANYSSNTVFTYFGNGSGNFTSFTALSGLSVVSPAALVVSDFNGDGRQDFIAANGNSSAGLVVRLGGADEIDLLGNNIAIASGDTIPAPADNTQFGNVGGNLVKSFIIRNTGTTPLLISDISISGADSASFIKGDITLPYTVAAGSSKNFTINFSPLSAGIKTAAVAVLNDDCDEAIYTFAIEGTGVAVTPALGSYADTTTVSNGTLSIAPAALPTNTNLLTAYTSSGFKGLLQVNPATGVVTVTNAHPAGAYTIFVKAHGITSATKSFLLTVSNPICSPGLFASTSTLTTSPYPKAVAVADFDGDGKQDFISANYLYNNMNVGLGTGNGTFRLLADLAIGTSPYAVAVADFNSDGRPDIAVANRNDNAVAVRMGDGAGGFTGTTNLATGATPQSLTIGDFNGDGKPDIAVSNYNSNNVSVWFGDGAGSFTGSTIIAAGINPSFIASGDFNNDGKTDLIIANYTDKTVSVRLGNGAGNFTNAADVSVGSSPTAVSTGDFNADGKTDIAIANGLNVSIRLGDGSSGFTGSTDVNVNGVASALTVGDFNGDGKADFAAPLGYSAAAVAIRLGDGNGNFSTATGVSVGNEASGIAIADFNGDGKQDLVVANSSTGSISIRLNNDREINVQGNSTTIPDGSNTPSVANHTEFSNTAMGNSSIRYYMIQNTGTANLTVTGITLSGVDSAAFMIGGITLPLTISGRSGVTFSVTYSPADGGVKEARVNIASNDCDEGLYDFAIRGKGICTTVSANNIWLGITADWNTASNWSLGFVPNGCGVAVVNAGVPFMPQISTAASCYSLTLNNGATFTVTGTGNLTITGP